MSRQTWLRRRVVRGDPVDPRPLEAAQLNARADTMRDMVRQQVDSMSREAQERELRDEEFVDDDEFFLADEQLVLSQHQLDDYAQTLISEQDPLPDPPAEPASNSPPRSEEDNSSTQSSTDADPSHSTQA